MANETEIALRTQQQLQIDPRRAALALDPFEPQTMGELYKFAETVCRTAFCPKDFQNKPDDCFVAMLHGKSLGLSALASIQGVGVINGRPSTYGETFWAVVISHPDFEDVQESVDDDGAVCIITRRGKTPKRGEFSRKDAETAQLLTKETYKKDAKAMFLWRARHRAASIFADALKGILPREVALDFIDGEVAASPRREPIPFADPAAGTKKERKPEPETIKAETTPEKPKEETKISAGETKPSEPETITPAQGTAWNKARKASGYTTEEATAYLKEKHGGIERTGQILAANFEDAMRWAQTPKVAEKSESKDDEKLAEECNGYWDRLNALESERLADIAKFTKANDEIDWNTLAMELHSRVEEIL